ncbi:MAG: bacillithiol biosynthesis cysteine-adding enzyme BshC [Cytophagales bacterium]|nr:bacillithiol biosynthesis cysteine-adding enzyme BshC [Cytophagales bacterium]
MDIIQIPFAHTNKYSELFCKYTTHPETFYQFIKYKPDIQGLSSAITDRKFDTNSRLILHNVLKEQYQNIQVSNLVTQNIDLITSQNTYTVTTGHQICIFTGPLYFVYKIITTIALCTRLKEQYPDKNFVPIYWMATEDHDWDEINHFHIFGKTYTFTTGQKGAVGDIDMSLLKSQFQDLPQDLQPFATHYINADTLAHATRVLVNELFGKYGLVILDANNNALKNIFVPYIEKEILERNTENEVNTQSQHLENMGYKAQIHPRDINLFYMQSGMRERIMYADGKYQVHNTQLSFDKHELLALLHNHPDYFSPNVVLRPLFQEVILPNIAYIGGPGELAYWLQLKSIFDSNNVPFPVLIPRLCALYISKNIHEKLSKLNLQISDLFLPLHAIKEVVLISTGALQYQEDIYKSAVNEIFNDIHNIAVSIDKSLGGMIDAKKHETHKALDEIHKRIVKEAEKKHETTQNQTTQIYHKLFPNGVLQERHDNILNIILNKPDFIATLLRLTNPFDYNLQIISEK